jgi:hypothetical protein
VLAADASNPGTELSIFPTLIARRVGAAALVLAALGVWFGMQPETDDAPNYANDVAAIEASDDANNEIADGAPQQEVVNGWTTTAYLSLLSKQAEEAAAPAPRDDRPAAMLGLCVAGIALLAATTPGIGGSRRSADATRGTAGASAAP